MQTPVFQKNPYQWPSNLSKTLWHSPCCPRQGKANHSPRSQNPENLFYYVRRPSFAADQLVGLYMAQSSIETATPKTAKAMDGTMEKFLSEPRQLGQLSARSQTVHIDRLSPCLFPAPSTRSEPLPTQSFDSPSATTLPPSELSARNLHPMRVPQTKPTSLNGGQPNFARCLAVSWAGTVLYILGALGP